jgi:hypothetical protein
MSDDTKLESLANRAAEAAVAKALAAITIAPVPRKYLDHAEAAEYLRRGQRTLDQLIAEGKGPKVYRAARGMRLYKISDLDSWVESQKAVA